MYGCVHTSVTFGDRVRRGESLHTALQRNVHLDKLLEVGLRSKNMLCPSFGQDRVEQRGSKLTRTGL